MTKPIYTVVLFCFTLSLSMTSVFAAELKPGEKKDLFSPEKHFEDTKSLDLAIHALKGEIEALRAEVAVLNALKPNFATFMPEFSERFHVMHAAGEAGDWAVAAHELLELQRQVKMAKHIDPAKGKLMDAFLSGNLHKVNEAISHGKKGPFLTALAETVKNCNNCHTAAGASYIKVSLGIEKILNMRHSHTFAKTDPGSLLLHKH